ncbi:AAA family ATPase [candidate division WWE3 bacterium]|nr:AAA family ATPase [candidate division WWE3 bacterium]
MFVIENIKIDWWSHLSFDKSIELEEGVNLIIGKNGSGKTSLLQMLESASRNANLSFPPDGLLTYSNGEELSKIQVRETSGDLSTLSFRVHGNNATWNNFQPLASKVRFITSDRKVNMTSAANNPIPIISKDISIPEPGAEIDISLEFTQAILKDLFEEVQKYTAKTNVAEDIVESYKEGLVDFDKDISIDLRRSQNPIFFTDYKGREIQINNLSSGEKEYLYFYAFLRKVRNDKDKIILIDEPELHLHSSQLRKLCELITEIGKNNQVVIATHSGEILQHFIDTNIVMLDKGTVTNISTNIEMKEALDSIGLPVDPSVFTAHWICAENELTKKFAGKNAPTTPELLKWIFGKSIKKRYWSFGNNYQRANAVIEGIKSVSSNPIPLKLHVILDGDKQVRSVYNYPPKKDSSKDTKVLYWPFWEIENVLLIPALVDQLVVVEDENKSGNDLLWEKIELNKEKLFSSIHKTTLKNQLRKYSVDKVIKKSPKEDLKIWKDKVLAITFDSNKLSKSFDGVISKRSWQWIPGKECLPLLLELEPKLWEKVRKLIDSGGFQDIIASVPELEGLKGKLK